jgi:hypothetical protein
LSSENRCQFVAVTLRPQFYDALVSDEDHASAVASEAARPSTATLLGTYLETNNSSICVSLALA